MVDIIGALYDMEGISKVVAGIVIQTPCPKSKSSEIRTKSVNMITWRMPDMSRVVRPFKGILHQKIFYRLNLIFWIVMGCGIARFGRRGLKTTGT